MRRASLFALLVTSLAWSASSSAARKKDWPCKGCLVDVPDTKDGKDGGAASPLLVVLHGDGQTAQNAAAPWEKALAARGWVLFAPQCPKSEGCTETSWWKWDHDPRWLDDQVKTIEAAMPIDADRIHLAGWSGGSSWMGYYAQKLVGRYASIGIHGGGMAPANRKTCEQSCPMPVRFLVGDKNPLHNLAKELRDYFDFCKHDVTWDLVPKADHGGELVALTKPAKIAQILDWFEAHPRKCPVLAAPAPSVTPMPSASSSASTPIVAPDETPDATAAAPVPTVAPGGRGCGCGASSRDVDGWRWLLAYVIVVCLRSRSAQSGTPRTRQ